MIYLAIALVLISLIFTKHPPQIKYHKTITVIHQQQLTTTTHNTQELSEQELREALDKAPPDLDDLLQAVNESLFDLDFGGDSQ